MESSQDSLDAGANLLEGPLLLVFPSMKDPMWRQSTPAPSHAIEGSKQDVVTPLSHAKMFGDLIGSRFDGSELDQGQPSID